MEINVDIKSIGLYFPNEAKRSDISFYFPLTPSKKSP